MFALITLNALLLAGTVIAAWGVGGIMLRGVTCDNALGVAAVRTATGLALLGSALFLLGMAGALTAVPVMALFVLSIALAVSSRGTLRRDGGWRPHAPVLLMSGALLPLLFVLALYPPHAFDETLYHLPTIERFATTGALPFIPALRAPVFPHLDEVLRVPLFLFGEDVSTHLLSIVATLVTAALVYAWAAGLAGERAGSLAAALWLSGPIVVQLATCSYVEATLTMFVAGCLYAFHQWRVHGETTWLVVAGLLAGSAAGSKYLGLFWLGIVGIGVLVLDRSGRRTRNSAIFAAAAILAAAPWYARILAYTGNPLFPYLGGIFGHTIWDGVAWPGRTVLERLTDVLRLPWDVLLARERVNLQPPMSPGLVLSLPFVLVLAVRDRYVRTIALVAITWAIVWTFLPADSRYLLPALPMLAVAGALALSRHVQLDSRALVITILLFLPGPLYGVYRVVKAGPVPHDAATRDAWLVRRAPEHAAVSFLDGTAGPDDVAYVCGGEQLAYHFRGEMIGDHTGPARYDRIAGARDAEELTQRLDAMSVRFVLVVNALCRIEAMQSAVDASRFGVVYDDGVATVYERIRDPREITSQPEPSVPDTRR